MPPKLTPTFFPQKDAAFIELMECLAVPKLFDGTEWIYEVKLNGYRAIEIRSGRGVRLLSRPNRSFNPSVSTHRRSARRASGGYGRRWRSRRSRCN
jgi:hypothetical protein